MNFYLIQLRKRSVTLYTEGEYLHPEAQRLHFISVNRLIHRLACRKPRWASFLKNLIISVRDYYLKLEHKIDPMERVFKGMRHASRMNLYFSPALEESVAREKFEDLLAGQRNKHLFWVGVDFVLTILAIFLTPVLVPLPGPNIFLYFPGLRMFSHYLAWRGTLNGLKLEDRSFIPLAEISSIEQVLNQRLSKVDFEHLRDLSRRLKLEHLPKFLERYS